MSFHVLIPARLASARLPNKPLADIGGAPMVVRVAQQALRSQAAQVVVAADSAAIADACAAHGIRAVLTDPDHPQRQRPLGPGLRPARPGRRCHGGQCARR